MSSCPLDKLSQEILSMIVEFLVEDAYAEESREWVRIVIPSSSAAAPAGAAPCTRSPALYSSYTILLPSTLDAPTVELIFDQLAHYTTIWRSSPSASGLRMRIASLHSADFASSQNYDLAVDALWRLLIAHAGDLTALTLVLPEQAVVHIAVRGGLALERLERLEVCMFFGTAKEDPTLPAPTYPEEDQPICAGPGTVPRFWYDHAEEDMDFLGSAMRLTELVFGFSSASVRTRRRHLLQLDRWAVPFHQLTALSMPNVWLGYYDCVEVFRFAEKLERLEIACWAFRDEDGIDDEHPPLEDRNIQPLPLLEFLEIRFERTIHAFLFAHFSAPSLQHFRIVNGARPESEWDEPVHMPWNVETFVDFMSLDSEIPLLEVSFAFSARVLDEIGINHDARAVRDLVTHNPPLRDLRLYWDPLEVSSLPGFTDLWCALAGEGTSALEELHLDGTLASVQAVTARVEAGLSLEQLELRVPEGEEIPEVGALKAALLRREADTLVKISPRRVPGEGVDLVFE
ncbi:hypothetical protein MKEN_00637900 [Mycena kentingensis (nom. inval.)]|nr:hypothetical protein MKEN_00637900 [Mycena kentingensis (nom. inval.)]